MQQYYCHLLVLICLEYSWIVIHAFGKTTSFGSTNKPTIIGKLLQILNFWSPKKSTYDNEKHLRSKTVILTTQRYQKKKNCRDFKYSCFTFNLIRQTVLDISCKNVEVVEFFFWQNPHVSFRLFTITYPCQSAFYLILDSTVKRYSVKKALLCRPDSCLNSQDDFAGDNKERKKILCDC